MESVVSGLELKAVTGEPVWLPHDDEEPVDPTAGTRPSGEWVDALGFEIRYQGVGDGGFQSGSSGPAHERLLRVAWELMSQVQDVVAVTTKEPWPVDIVHGRRNMAQSYATLEGNHLHMWYGDRAAPALKVPPVSLV
jgi:hypothetical protein